MVVDGGVTKLYINSTTPVATFPVVPTPAVPGDTFVIGAAAPFGGRFIDWGSEHRLVGGADEVRVFEFEPGAFTAADDLLYAVPEPTTGLSLLTGSVSLAGIVRLRRKAR